MGAYLNIDHLSKTFGRGSKATQVLRDVTLRVDQGEFVSIIGHSGCGKSTLLNIVAGLTGASVGGVILEGKEVNTPGPDRAVVFQNHSLLPWLTVYENVKLAVDKVFGATKTRAERRDWILHNLALVHMSHAKDKLPSEISGGMKQRAGIARALAMEPKVLLLDEPFGALDALTREELSLELSRLWQHLGRTAMLITHDIEEAILLGDRVVVMSKRPGQIRLDVPVELPRPRDAGTAKLPRFAEVTQLVRDVIFVPERE